MPKFSKASEEKLQTCDSRLHELMNELIKHYDCIILCGHRNEKEQNEAFAKGFSKLKWPNGKHNKSPSLAVDVAPYPLDWNDHKRFIHMAGIIQGIALIKGIKIRWGGDFNKDYNLSNDKFIDLPHFEISE